MPGSINLFISYSHDDVEYKDNIIKFLSPLRTNMNVHCWDDAKIRLGQDWDQEIQEAFEASRIILLLISADFLDSTYIMNKELKWSLEKHSDKNSNVCVIPVYIRECLLEANKEITDIQGVPAMDNPISSFEDKDKAYTLVARRIAEHVKEIIDLDDLELSKRVSQFKKEYVSKSVNELGDRHRIYLSAGIDPDQRKAIFQELHYRKEWDHWKYEVIPNPEQANHLKKLTGIELKQKIKEYLDQSLFSVHLIDNAEDAASELIRSQYQMAEQHCSEASFRCILAISDKEAEQEFYKNTDKSYLTNPAIVKVSNWTKTTIIKKIDRLIEEHEQRLENLKRKANKMGGAEETVFLLYHNDDENSQVRDQLMKGFADQKVDVAPNVFDQYQEDDYSIREYELQKVQESDGVIIFYGRADHNWCKIRQDLVLKKSDKLKGVCVDEPDIQSKIIRNVRRTKFQLLNHERKLKEDIEDFVNKLRE